MGSRGQDTGADGNISLATEETPLLNGHGTSSTGAVDAASTTLTAADDGNDEADEANPPLPWSQLVPLCFARVVEPIAFFSIFPFVNQMIKDNGDLEYSQVGFYSGMIESLFSLTQMFVMIWWGRASDRYGRKPVLVVSLAGVGLTMGAFGLCKTIWQMIALRCLAGVFAGTVVTLRTIYFELSTPKTQARVFSWFAFMGNIGIFVGPLLGGVLADPVEQYPNVFKNVQLFKDFPYILATAVSGFVGLFAAAIVVLFVNETLPKTTAEEDSGVKPPPPSTRSLFYIPGVPLALGLYGYVMLLAFAYTAIAPVYYFTPIEYGGYGFTKLQISIFMGTGGLAQAVWLLGFFPPLQRRYGTSGVTQLCGIGYPFFFAAYPALYILLRSGLEGSRTAFWIIAGIVNAIGPGVAMAFTTSMLTLNNLCPAPEVLATLNALSLTLVSGIRAFTPAAATSLFALGVDHEILWGQFSWVIMIILAVLHGIGTRWLPDDADIKAKNTSDEGM